MKSIIAYLVMEQHDDGTREPFGLHGFEETPKVGDIVTLRWLDGTTAYDVVIREVHESDLEVIAEPMKDALR